MTDPYLLDNAAAMAGSQLDALAQLFDPSTFLRSRVAFATAPDGSRMLAG